LPIPCTYLLKSSLPDGLKELDAERELLVLEDELLGSGGGELGGRDELLELELEEGKDCGGVRLVILTKPSRPSSLHLDSSIVLNEEDGGL
jgi:hypothetical protein